MSRKNTLLAFSLIVLSFSVIGWGTKHNVSENSPISQVNNANLNDEKIDENSPDQKTESEVNAESKPEKILSLVKQIENLQKHIKTLTVVKKINSCNLEIDKICKNLKEMMHVDETYEQQLEKTPELFQIAMKSRPVQEMEEGWSIGRLGEKNGVLNLNKSYQFCIMSEPTELNTHQGYCVTTLKIDGHLSEERVFTWNKDICEYVEGFRAILPSYAKVYWTNLSSFKEALVKVDALRNSKVEINLKAKFSENGIFLSEIYCMINGLGIPLVDQQFPSPKNFMDFLYMLPEEISKIVKENLENSVGQNISASVVEDDESNLEKNFKDHVNLVDSGTDQSLAEQENRNDSALNILNQIQNISAKSKMTSDPSEIVIYEYQLTELKYSFAKALGQDEPYEQRLEKAPRLFQIAMNSRPVQKMDQDLVLGKLLISKKEGIGLDQFYQFHIMSEPTQLNTHQGYCFTTLKIDGHLSEERVFTWDKSNNQYVEGFREILPNVDKIEWSNLESVKAASDKADAVSKDNVNIILTVKFLENKIYANDIHILKNGKNYRLDNHCIESLHEFVGFLNIMPESVNKIL